MKKHYVKPEIVFEDFSLNTSISAGCEHISNQSQEDQCGYVTRSGVIFTTTLTGCDFTENVTVEGEYIIGNNTICYHIPDQDNNLFSS